MLKTTCLAAACLGFALSDSAAAQAELLFTIEPPASTSSATQFGFSVAVDEDLLVVGNPALFSSTFPGTAFVYDADTGAFLRELVVGSGSPFGDTDGSVGYDVAVDSGTAVVGGLSQLQIIDGVANVDAGGAWVFDATTGTLMHELLGSDTDERDFFGYSVAVEGEFVAVGAPNAGHPAPGQPLVSAGAVYVFDRATGVQLYKLEGDGDANQSDFGIDVAMSDGVLVVGEPVLSAGAEGLGAAYAFDAATGTRLQKWTAQVGPNSIEFGRRVAIDDSKVLITGADGGVFDVTNGERVGAPYTGPNGFTFYGADLEGDRAVIGSNLEVLVHDVPSLLPASRIVASAPWNAGSSLALRDDRAYLGLGGEQVLVSRPLSEGWLRLETNTDFSPLKLFGFGDLNPGEEASLKLVGAPSGVMAAAFVAFDPVLPTTFKQGTLVTNPVALTAFTNTDGDGEIELIFDWPLDAPPGFTLFVQFGVVDVESPSGVSLTNGLRGTTP